MRKKIEKKKIPVKTGKQSRTEKIDQIWIPQIDAASGHMKPLLVSQGSILYDVGKRSLFYFQNEQACINFISISYITLAGLKLSEDAVNTAYKVLKKVDCCDNKKPCCKKPVKNERVAKVAKKRIRK